VETLKSFRRPRNYQQDKQDKKHIYRAYTHTTEGRVRQPQILNVRQELGWDTLTNGELLSAAEKGAFEVFLTTDKDIRYQQNLGKRPSPL
jgi:hypothetical protein